MTYTLILPANLDLELSGSFSNGKTFIALESLSGDLIISFAALSCNSPAFNETLFFVLFKTAGLALKKK